MQENHWEKIEKIFNRAAVLPVAERRAFIEDVCREDEELCREILALIEADGEADCFLDEPNFDLGLQILADGRVGTRISRYVILKLIGQGGMGEVYLARDVENGQTVALKLLNETATKDADRVRRFRQEARAASLIKHHNVTQVYEIGEVENNQFIAMEYVDGVTLRERLKANSPSMREALTIAGQIAAALEAAHSNGIIHRDLKPENVMIERVGQIKVLDFGLAKLTKPAAFQTVSKNATAQANLLTDGNSTAFGMVFGTAGYMSPEQARGQKTDERTDIWSFGVLLYEMLAGVPPFRGKTNLDVIAAVLTAEPASLTSIFPDLPFELSNLISQTLQKESADRPQNCQIIMSELRRVSERLQGDSALTATRPSNSVLNDQTLSSPHRTTADNNKTAKENQTRVFSDKKKAQNFFYAFVSAFVVAVLGIAGYFYVNRPNASPADVASANAVQTNAGANSNSEAEREYQRGRYIWNKRDGKEMPKALVHFQKAIDLDPGFARAYAGLADAYSWDGNPNLTREEKSAHVKAAAQRALAIDPNLAEARTTLAMALGSERDWNGLEREYRKAIESDPNYPTAHHWFAEYLTFVGRDEEAVAHINKALELDPLSYAILNDAITINWFVGRYTEAIDKAEKMIIFDARYEKRSRLWLARLSAHIENNERARKEFERFVELSNGKVSDMDYANFYALVGDKEKALSYLKKVETSKDKINQELGFAGTYALLGMREEAFKWLEIAFENRHPSIVALAANPDFDSLRSDPRYVNLLERMNLAEFWRDKLNQQ